MNKKLLKSIVCIASGMGLATSIPFAVSGCSMDGKESAGLKCDIKIEDISQNFQAQVNPTPAIDDKIYTDTGDSVTGVTFTCEGLTEKTGLTINQTTGVISGTLTKKPSNPEFKIKFTADVDDKSLVGYTNTFNITVNPTKLVCDKALDAISVNLDSKITPTIDISGLIKTDTGESVKNEVDDLKFSSNNLPTGLSINQSTGVISGTTTRIQESKSSTILFSCTFDGISLQGSTQINIEVNGPQSIVCSEIEDQSIVVNTSFSLGVSDIKMVFDGGVQKSLSSSDIASYELVDKDGKSAASTLPQGLSFNTSQGKISGTVTSLNYYAPQTYKIKITGSARIGSKVGYSNTFTLSMKNNPLPDTVYDIDANNVLLGFKEGIDLTQYKDACNTMQIPARVTSVGEMAFLNSDAAGSSKIPSFIKRLTFAENSNCSSIGQFSFGASPLTSITLPSGLTTITDFSFANCQELTSVKFPSGLESIDDQAFIECSKLTSVDLLNTNISSIGVSAFQGCLELASIRLPSSLTKISANAFNGCSKLSNIEWNLPTNYPSITISSDVFANISSTGSVKSLNTSIATSQQLFNWIKTKGSFPSTGWGPAD